ncbi:hypothetical protein ACHQM5_021148 [Ranunculus cassubicifolius]
MSSVRMYGEEVMGSNPSKHINLYVKNQQDGRRISYKVKRNLVLGRLMDAYCEKHVLDVDTVVFLYDEHRINKNETPEQLKMEDDDEIDVMLHQSGGSGLPAPAFYLNSEGWCFSTVN